MNQEGYRDPTAEKVMREYNRMPHRMREALNAVQNVASLMGFELVEVRDKRTGKMLRTQMSLANGFHVVRSCRR